MDRLYLHIFVIIAAMAMTAFLNSAFAGTEQGHGAAGHKSAAAHILDGKKFQGPTGEKGKKLHHVDMLIFDNGRFTSTECLKFGFESGPYSATIQNDSIQFKAETHSAALGKMEWSGTLKGDTLNVTYYWTKERWLWTTYREYWFKGTSVK